MTDRIWAERLADDLLSAADPNRWHHVCAVADLAGRMSRKLDDEDGRVLVDAAWLHDIGYAASLRVTGFHPLDGANFLRGTGCRRRLCALVAHHSSAHAEAVQLGLDLKLNAYVDERSLVRDLLWFADMTTGPVGQRMSFRSRMAEVKERYGPQHYVVEALGAGMPEREAAMRRAHEWIESVGLPAQV